MSSTYNRLLVLGRLKSIIPIVSWLESLPALLSFSHPFNAKSKAFLLRPVASSCRLSYMDLADDVKPMESVRFTESDHSFESFGAPAENDRCNMLITNKQMSKFRTLTFLIIFILLLIEMMHLLH